METPSAQPEPRDQHPLTARTVAVVLCAGQGTRMDAGQNKVFLPLDGVPILARALQAFERATTVDEVLLVAHPDEVAYVASEIVGRNQFRKVSGVVAGGATRHQSEQRALDALRERIVAGAVGMVLIHDGARPFVTPDDITRVIAAARTHCAAILAAPVSAGETLFAVASDGKLHSVASGEEGLPGGPEELMQAQTPQAFEARTLLAAYDRARADGFEGTDTAAALERLGLPVAAVPGSRANLKITTRDDLLRAEALLREQIRVEQAKE